MKIDRAISSLRFVYPFLFSANEYRLRVKTIEQAVWQGRDRPLAVWRRLEFPSEDLLDHLGKYLNAPEGTAYLWELEAAALQSQHGLGSGFDWALHFPRGEARFEFEAPHFDTLDQRKLEGAPRDARLAIPIHVQVVIPILREKRPVFREGKLPRVQVPGLEVVLKGDALARAGAVGCSYEQADDQGADD